MRDGIAQITQNSILRWEVRSDNLVFGIKIVLLFSGEMGNV